MSASAQAITLPEVTRLFPLTGAVLFPDGLLPLNIFEPRYLAMVRDAMADDRMIGIIQPKDDAEPPALHGVGALGRIIEFAETPDGRFVIVLQGVIRFRIAAEVETEQPYRQARVSYDDFLADLREAKPLGDGIRDQVEASLKTYLDAQGLSADWEAVAQADDDGLVRTLAGVCPFDPIEKQALLEAPNLPARADILIALMRFAPGTAAEAPSSRLQ